MEPRGIRNNNPGNIKHSVIKFDGEIPSDDPVFKEFETPEKGIRAIDMILIHYYRADQSKGVSTTVQGVIDRWAPPNENDTAAYVDACCSEVCVLPSDPIILYDRATLVALCRAIIHHENGEQPYSDEQLITGANLALAAVGHPVAGG